MARSSTIIAFLSRRRHVLAAAIVAVVAVPGEASARPPRTERVIERRLERLETMERRLEAATQLPPRPADVRRMVRRGAPVPGLGPNPGSAPAATAASRVMPNPTAPTATARITPPPRPAASQPAPQAIARPAAPKPAAAPTTDGPPGVSQATAIDDGTQSVLVFGEPTPAAAPATAEPVELLPTPTAK